MLEDQNLDSLKNPKIIKLLESKARERLNRDLQLDEKLPDLNLNELFDEQDDSVESTPSLVSQDSLSLTSIRSKFMSNSNTLSCSESTVTSLTSSNHLAPSTANNSTYRGISDAAKIIKENNEILESDKKRIRRQHIPYQHVPATKPRLKFPNKKPS